MHSSSLARTQRRNLTARDFLEVMSGLIWDLMVLLETLLAFRFLLKIAGANATAGLTSLTYGASDPFVRPFSETLMPTPVPGAITPSVFEWPTILAMIAYPIMTWTVLEIIRLLKAQPRRARYHRFRHVIGQARS